MKKESISSSSKTKGKKLDFSSVLVLLPALNEEVGISSTIKNINRSLPNAEIVVIDNGSIDQTSEIAVKCGARVVREPQKGKGFAVRRGFRESSPRTSAVVMLDADDTYSCESLGRAVEMVRVGGYDLIVGNRIPMSDSQTRKPAYKRGHSLGNKFFSKFSTLLHPVGISDSLSGWRVMSSGFVRSFPGGASGFEIEAEMNAHAYLLKCAVANVDVAYKGRELTSHSKLRTYRDGFRILRMNLTLFRNNRPQLAFTLLATPWLIASTLLTWRALYQYIQTGLVLQFPSLIAGVGCFLTALLLIITGMILHRVKNIRENLAQFQFNREKDND